MAHPSPEESLQRSTNRFTRRPVLTSAILLILLLGGVELGLRLVDPPALRFAWESRQIYRTHEEWRVDFEPSTSARMRPPSPDRPGRALLDFEVHVNRHGFRHDPSAPTPTPDQAHGRTVVHALGDSFTMGWGVSARDAYPAVLQERLGPRFLVLNLGLNGYGALGAVGKSQLVSEAYPPDLVVWVATENDYDDDERALRHRKRPAVVHRMLEGVDALRRTFYLASAPFALRWAAWRRTLPRPPENVDPDEPVRSPPATGTSDPELGTATKDALLELAADLASRDVPLLVVTHGDGPVARDLAAFCDRRGIEIRRLLFPQRFLIPGDGHLEPDGNRALAEVVQRWIESLGSQRPPATRTTGPTAPQP